MTIQSDHFAQVVQLPLGPDPDLGGRMIDVTVTFEPADIETIWQTAEERGLSIQDLIHQAVMNDVFR